LVYKKGIGVDERIVEIKMAYYYQNMGTEDLVMADQYQILIMDIY